MASERWRRIDDYPNYCVSDEGRIKNNVTNRVLKSCPDSHGYPQVILSNNGFKKAFLIHRLVAEAFIDGYDQNLQVNHRDGNKANNCASNLEWITGSGNMRHAYDTGLAHRSKMAGTKPIPVRVIETGDVFDSESECAIALGIKREGINACINGRLNSYFGLHFERIG